MKGDVKEESLSSGVPRKRLRFACGLLLKGMEVGTTESGVASGAEVGVGTNVGCSVAGATEVGVGTDMGCSIACGIEVSGVGCGVASSVEVSVGAGVDSGG